MTVNIICYRCNSQLKFSLWLDPNRDVIPETLESSLHLVSRMEFSKCRINSSTVKIYYVNIIYSHIVHVFKYKFSYQCLWYFMSPSTIFPSKVPLLEFPTYIKRIRIFSPFLSSPYLIQSASVPQLLLGPS